MRGKSFMQLETVRRPSFSRCVKWATLTGLPSERTKKKMSPSSSLDTPASGSRPGRSEIGSSHAKMAPPRASHA